MTDFDTRLDISKTTEGDVETRVVLPLLTESHLLKIPLEWIKSKSYIRPLTIGKGKKKQKGFIPDYLIMINAIPLVVIEVKSPKETVDTAYDEASAYAHELNRIFSHKVNPCKIIVGCNGEKIKIGYWDEGTGLTVNIKDINAGSSVIENIRKFISKGSLESFSNATAAKIKLNDFKRPFNRKRGENLILTKMPPNSFARQITPILNKYFSSQDLSEEINKIWTKGYISSNETTSYEANLESLLKDRVATAGSRPKVLLKTTKKSEKNLEGSLRDFINKNPNAGKLQIITGSVGAGKSLFIRRYKELLQPPEVKSLTNWAFIDFNSVFPDINKLDHWTCEKFIDSIMAEGASFDITDRKDQDRIFSTMIHKNRAIYQRLNEANAKTGDVRKAEDIEKWLSDPIIATKSVANYLQENKREPIIIVFDNVDRQGPDEQLKIFQLAMWMKAETKAFIIIQMRDVTFEQYKNQPPLDTYKTGLVFHITPPKFVDVVKKRLELSLEHLAQEAPEVLEFIAQNGTKITYPRSNTGKYLKIIYDQIFIGQQNIARLLQALSDRNVRDSLNMFMSILTSGHMIEGRLGEQVAFGQSFKIENKILVRTLMRGDYCYYHNTSSFISNLFHCENTWERPSNFHLIEILHFLLEKRKTKGDNGVLGYLSFATIARELERKGMIEGDVRKACLYALEKNLIEGDNLLRNEVSDTACFKATASAWLHMSFLSGTMEYLTAILYSTSLNDEPFTHFLSSKMEEQHSFGEHRFKTKLGILKGFCKYLKKQNAHITSLYINVDPEEKTGANVIIERMEKVIQTLEEEYKNKRNRNYSTDLLKNVDLLKK